MKVAIIGRSEFLYETTKTILNNGYEVPLIISAKETIDYKVGIDDFHELAKKIGAKFILAKELGEMNNVRKIIDTNQIDIGISVNFPYILNNNFINLFKYGILNAHGGDLPRYRGNACQAWAIINGEKRIGLCVHKMEPGELDSGDIISKEYLNINSNTKILEIYKWIEQKTPILFLDSLRKLQENSSYILQKQSKNPKDILMCYPRKPDDGRINWLMKSIDIHRLVNASGKPYQGAFCYFENKKYFVNDTNIVKYKHRILALPGQILKISDDFLDVATGDGVIRIKEINYKNKIVNIKKIFKSIRLRLS